MEPLKLDKRRVALELGLSLELGLLNPLKQGFNEGQIT
jgi:hypothetical protein